MRAQAGATRNTRAPNPRKKPLLPSFTHKSLAISVTVGILLFYEDKKESLQKINTMMTARVPSLCLGVLVLPTLVERQESMLICSLVLITSAGVTTTAARVPTAVSSILHLHTRKGTSNKSCGEIFAVAFVIYLQGPS